MKKIIVKSATELFERRQEQIHIMELRFWDEVKYLVTQLKHTNGAIQGRIEFTLFSLARIANLSFAALVKEGERQLKEDEEEKIPF